MPVGPFDNSPPGGGSSAVWLESGLAAVMALIGNVDAAGTSTLTGLEQTARSRSPTKVK